MATVTLRNHGNLSVEAISTGDTWSGDSWKYARNRLYAEGVMFDKALIDRFAGLVLIGADMTVHFEHAVCGYDGTGPQTTAKILCLFGFGSYESIMETIKTGGDEAAFVFYR